jgi:hypothetical protein
LSCIQTYPALSGIYPDIIARAVSRYILPCQGYIQILFS